MRYFMGRIGSCLTKQPLVGQLFWFLKKKKKNNYKHIYIYNSFSNYILKELMDLKKLMNRVGQTNPLVGLVGNIFRILSSVLSLTEQPPKQMLPDLSKGQQKWGKGEMVLQKGLMENILDLLKSRHYNSTIKRDRKSLKTLKKLNKIIQSLSPYYQV